MLSRRKVSGFFGTLGGTCLLSIPDLAGEAGKFDVGLMGDRGIVILGVEACDPICSHCFSLSATLPIVFLGEAGGGAAFTDPFPFSLGIGRGLAVVVSSFGTGLRVGIAGVGLTTPDTDAGAGGS